MKTSYIILIISIVFTSCATMKKVDRSEIAPFNIEGKKVHKKKSGLEYIIVEKGEGKEVTWLKKVKVHYTGYFKDGKIFDSSVERGKPFVFTVGKGEVIRGWDEGVDLMKEGAKYRFIIPYKLAYGKKGISGIIPPKTDLIFDVEVIKAK